VAARVGAEPLVAARVGAEPLVAARVGAEPLVAARVGAEPLVSLGQAPPRYGTTTAAPWNRPARRSSRAWLACSSG